MASNKTNYPSDVGIIALEIYFPSRFVDQTELEKFDGASAGKYTIGLGQSKMGFCDDREDVNSLCLTVVNNLMERNKLCYKNIGRLEVGTETIIDKSKSVKSVLMQLFEESGNTDVEGIDTTNACYGGTAALFNAFNWIESSSWDGRLALVVCADIAVYATGNARPTGGAGAVAMLVGPNASLIYEQGTRSSHMQHAYDFYKPNLMSEYPVVDGKLSVECYLSALDKCYQLFKSKFKSKCSKSDFTLDDAEAFLFHSPYCKLVQKSLARLLLNDFVCDPEAKNKYPDLEKFRSLKLSETYFDRDVEQAVLKASEAIFSKKTKPFLLIANQVGNMYTPSLYGGLASYIYRTSLNDIANKRVMLFSYGSGLASSMFSLRGADTSHVGLQKLHESLSDLAKRLDSRAKIHPQVFEQTMKLREDTHHLAPYSAQGNVGELFNGTWYLQAIDDKHRRTYKRTLTSKCSNGAS